MSGASLLQPNYKKEWVLGHPTTLIALPRVMAFPTPPSSSRHCIEKDHIMIFDDGIVYDNDKVVVDIFKEMCVCVCVCVCVYTHTQPWYMGYEVILW